MAFNKLMGGRQELLENCRLTRQALCDCTAIEKEIAELWRESEGVSELAREAIYEIARTAANQEQFFEKSNGYLQHYNRIIERLSNLEAQRLKHREKGKLLEHFIRDIETRPLLLEEFDEKLWTAVIDKVTVGSDGMMVFCFKDGIEIEG
jgi:site-specific DNA recombinase